MTSSARTEWLVRAGLLVLSIVPVAAGAFRPTELTVGADTLGQVRPPDIVHLSPSLSRRLRKVEAALDHPIGARTTQYVQFGVDAAARHQDTQPSVRL